jgi:Aspartyl/Asparaginyl beta-hydroxylase
VRNFLRIAQNMEVMPLLMEITRNQDWWHADDYLRSYPQGPFGEVDSIILRFPPRSVHDTEEAMKAHLQDARYDPHECIDLPIYAQIPVARLLVMRIFSYVGATRLGRVMINRIKPGGRIFSHADTLEHAVYWQRHHVVLQSAPGVIFEAGDESVYMAPGDVWWFNNGKPDKDGVRPEHQVINNSAVDRIHLILDCKIP